MKNFYLASYPTRKLGSVVETQLNFALLQQYCDRFPDLFSTCDDLHYDVTMEVTISSKATFINVNFRIQK